MNFSNDYRESNNFERFSSDYRKSENFERLSEYMVVSQIFKLLNFKIFNTLFVIDSKQLNFESIINSCVSFVIISIQQPPVIFSIRLYFLPSNS